MFFTDFECSVYYRNPYVRNGNFDIATIQSYGDYK